MVYSGRRNPEWRVDNKYIERLETIWAELAPWVGSDIPPSRLGYQGCTLVSPKGDSWFINGEFVSRESDGEIEKRSDPARRYEKMLLSSAPADLLPPWVPTGDNTS